MLRRQSLSSRRRLHKERRYGIECLESRLLLSSTGNQQVTDSPAPEQSPAIAVNPNNPNHVIVAYSQFADEDSNLNFNFDTESIGVRVSEDGGDTWTNSAIRMPAGFDQRVSDPVVLFDSNGNSYVAFSASTFRGISQNSSQLTELQIIDGLQSSNGIFVSKSSDGGQTWSAAIDVITDIPDAPIFGNLSWHAPYNRNPQLAIDSFATAPDGTNNPNLGNLYITWERFYSDGDFPGQPEFRGGGEIMIAVSEDSGASWQVKRQAGPDSVSVIHDNFLSQSIPRIASSFVTHPSLAIGPEGDVFVAISQAGLFAVFQSTDGGESFIPPDTSGTGRGRPFGFIESGTTATAELLAGLDSRVIAAHPTIPGVLFAAQISPAIGRGGVLDPADVLLSWSPNSGESWFIVSLEEAINDDNSGRRILDNVTKNDVISTQASLEMTFDENGNLFLNWYDTRRSAPGQPGLVDLMGTVGTVETINDETVLFIKPNFRLTDRSFTLEAGSFTLGTTEHADLGRHTALTSAAGTIYSAWTDNRNGNQDIFFASFSSESLPPTENDRFGPNGSSAAPTELGTVSKKFVPQLTLSPNEEDWFSLSSLSGDNLIVTLFPSEDFEQIATSFQLEIWNLTGDEILATGTVLADEAGIRAIVSDIQATEFLVRVAPTEEFLQQPVETKINYSLDLESLAANLGASVYEKIDGTLSADGTKSYLITAPAAGSIDVTFFPGLDFSGEIQLQVFDLETLSLLETGVSIPNSVVTETRELDDTLPTANQLEFNQFGSVEVLGFIGDDPEDDGDIDYYSMQLQSGQ